MASKKVVDQVVHKLHAVTLIRSGIGRPYWQKRTLKVLKLTKMHKTVIHKNTPTINGQLLSVKELVLVRPLVVRTDVDNSPSGGEYYTENGNFFMDKEPLKHPNPRPAEDSSSEHANFKSD